MVRRADPIVIRIKTPRKSRSIPKRLAQLVAGIAPVFGDAVPADLVRASVLRPWAGLFEF